MKKQICDVCGNFEENVHITHIEDGDFKKVVRLCEKCYTKLQNEQGEKIMFFEQKTNLRCINCGKKLKKRIYTNGKTSYVCIKCKGEE